MIEYNYVEKKKIKSVIDHIKNIQSLNDNRLKSLPNRIEFLKEIGFIDQYTNGIYPWDTLYYSTIKLYNDSGSALKAIIDILILIVDDLNYKRKLNEKSLENIFENYNCIPNDLSDICLTLEVNLYYIVETYKEF